jgi:hypothetical protein
MCVKLPKINKNVVLQIVFKPLNNTARPNKLVLILLVFKAYLLLFIIISYAYQLNAMRNYLLLG